MGRETESGLHRVYCAGPLFNGPERDEMTVIADALCAAGYGVYLPHRDGMEFRHVRQSLISQGWSAEVAGRFLHAAIFALDVFQLAEDCDSMVWNLNGRVPDEGAVSEAAMAWILGKPLVAYKDDARTLIESRDNPLLVGMVEFETVPRIADIVPALRTCIEDFAARRIVAPAPLPPAVQRTIQQGRELWNVLQSQHATGNNAVIAEVVANLFAGSVSVTTAR